MGNWLSQLPLFGVFLSITAYVVGLWIQKRTKISVLSPFVVAVLLVITFLALTRFPYDTYAKEASHLSFLLTPATVCLAIPLYQQLDILKANWKSVLFGVLAGVIVNAAGILLLARLFGIDHVQYVTLLPKSVTAAIGMSICQEYGGILSITVAATVVTGITGNVLAPLLCKLLRIHEPVARGVAIGTASHVIGTARAMEMGQTEGALSGLSIALTGILTVLVLPFFVGLL